MSDVKPLSKIPQTFGEAIALYPWLACAPHEWDNRTTAENAGYLLATLTAKVEAAEAKERHRDTATGHFCDKCKTRIFYRDGWIEEKGVYWHPGCKVALRAEAAEADRDRLHTALAQIAPMYGDCSASDMPHYLRSLQVASQIAQETLHCPPKDDGAEPVKLEVWGAPDIAPHSVIHTGSTRWFDPHRRCYLVSCFNVQLHAAVVQDENIRARLVGFEVFEASSPGRHYPAQGSIIMDAYRAAEWGAAVRRHDRVYRACPSCGGLSPTSDTFAPRGHKPWCKLQAVMVLLSKDPHATAIDYTPPGDDFPCASPEPIDSDSSTPCASSSAPPSPASPTTGS